MTCSLWELAFVIDLWRPQSGEGMVVAPPIERDCTTAFWGSSVSCSLGFGCGSDFPLL